MPISNHPAYARIMTLTNSFITSVSTQQADYFIANGKYFQGIPLASDLQPDGETDVTVDTTKKPTDQNESWFDFLPGTFKNNLKIPFRVTLNTYISPQGHGWTIDIDLWRDGLGPDTYGNDGSHWKYRHHEGPATPYGIFDVWHIISDYPEI